MPNKRLVLFKSFVVSSFQLKFCLHFFYSFKKRLVLTHSLETISRSLPRFWKSFPCQRSWQSLSWIQIFSEVPQNPISKSSVSEKKKKTSRVQRYPDMIQTWTWYVHTFPVLQKEFLQNKINWILLEQWAGRIITV